MAPLAQPPRILYSQREICVVEMQVCHKPVMDALVELCKHGFGEVVVKVQDGRIQIIHLTKAIRPDN
jgi:hypothetical protein